MDTTPFWKKGRPATHFPKLAESLSVDVVVVGGGVTGITTAYLLKKAGKTVALIERDECLSGDSGHTTAHLTSFPDMRFSGVIKHLGKEAALQVWRAGEEAIQEIAAIVAEESVACGFEWVPGIYCGKIDGDPRRNEKDIQDEVDAADALNIPFERLRSAPRFGTPGISFPQQALFHPQDYLTALLNYIPGDGCHVFEHTAAEGIEEDPIVVHTNDYRIEAEQVVIATHNPLTGNSGLLRSLMLQTKLSLYSSYALSARIPRGLFPAGLYWDNEDPYHYLRVQKEGESDRAIFGGEDHKTGQINDTFEAYGRLERSFRALVGEGVIDSFWSGQVIETTDGLPYIGSTGPSQFIATGFSGNGFTWGTLAAKMAVDFVLERENPWSALFSPKRKIGFSEVGAYVAENKDYPVQFVKRRLGVPAFDEDWDLGAGEGKVVSFNGEKAAAYRADDGEVLLCSAVCTHMKGIVAWNPAEKTWDCPCHGARFKPTGEVIAGPAEESLRRIVHESDSLPVSPEGTSDSPAPWKR